MRGLSAIAVVAGAALAVSAVPTVGTAHVVWAEAEFDIRDDGTPNIQPNIGVSLQRTRDRAEPGWALADAFWLRYRPLVGSSDEPAGTPEATRAALAPFHRPGLTVQVAQWGSGEEIRSGRSFVRHLRLQLGGEYWFAGGGDPNAISIEAIADYISDGPVPAERHYFGLKLSSVVGSDNSTRYATGFRYVNGKAALAGGVSVHQVDPGGLYGRGHLVLDLADLFNINSIGPVKWSLDVGASHGLPLSGNGNELDGIASVDDLMIDGTTFWLGIGVSYWFLGRS